MLRQRGSHTVVVNARCPSGYVALCVVPYCRGLRPLRRPTIFWSAARKRHATRALGPEVGSTRLEAGPAKLLGSELASLLVHGVGSRVWSSGFGVRKVNDAYGEQRAIGKASATLARLARHRWLLLWRAEPADQTGTRRRTPTTTRPRAPRHLPHPSHCWIPLCAGFVRQICVSSLRCSFFDLGEDFNACRTREPVAQTPPGAHHVCSIEYLPTIRITPPGSGHFAVLQNDSAHLTLLHPAHFA